MTKSKRNPKSKKPPTVVVQSTENTDTAADTRADAEQQFEVELYWCIHQLQTALNSGKLSPKQVQDHTKGLNILMSKTAPLVQKRQVMRLSFGDYRSKMVAEEKKYSKVNMQVKLTPGKPSSKTIFVKKSVVASSDNSFKFNFEVPKSDDNTVQDNVEEKPGKPSSKTIFVKKSVVASSDNSFKFNFEVPKSDNNTVQDKVEEKMEVQLKSSNNFGFMPSDNSFKFNFDVTN